MTRSALPIVAVFVSLSLASCGSDTPTSTDGGGGAGSPAAGGAASRSTGGGAATAGSVALPTESTPEDSLSARHPGDADIANDPAVLFHDDFENGWGRWDSPSGDTEYLHLETDDGLAHAGEAVLRSTVTADHLAAQQYISSATSVEFPESVDTVYWRFYARFAGISVTPHHWIRMAAGNQGFSSSGLANTVPSGEEGFWFDFDANTDDVFNFYVYWYQMRSGRCNDGSTTDGCEGDQGTTYHYGNMFRPPDQAPFPRDEWFCVEIMAHANSVGSSDGALAFWVNNALVGDYRPGNPVGTWLRDSFHTGGCDFSACTDPEPFEGFDFRSNDAVRFKGIFLDAYYERESTANRRETLVERGLDVIDEQTVYYDDVVVATERIGCMVTAP